MLPFRDDWLSWILSFFCLQGGDCQGVISALWVGSSPPFTTLSVSAAFVRRAKSPAHGKNRLVLTSNRSGGSLEGSTCCLCIPKCCTGLSCFTRQILKLNSLWSPPHLYVKTSDTYLPQHRENAELKLTPKSLRDSLSITDLPCFRWYTSLSLSPHVIIFHLPHMCLPWVGRMGFRGHWE